MASEGGQACLSRPRMIRDLLAEQEAAAAREVSRSAAVAAVLTAAVRACDEELESTISALRSSQELAKSRMGGSFAGTAACEDALALSRFAGHEANCIGSALNQVSKDEKQEAEGEPDYSRLASVSAGREVLAEAFAEEGKLQEMEGEPNLSRPSSASARRKALAEAVAEEDELPETEGQPDLSWPNSASEESSAEEDEEQETKREPSLSWPDSDSSSREALVEPFADEDEQPEKEGEPSLSQPTSTFTSQEQPACASGSVGHFMAVTEASASQHGFERNRAVLSFLKENGYRGVDKPRRKIWRRKYAIHTAAKQGDSRMVQMLLDEGADRVARTSQGKTAVQIAREKDRNGSHTAVLRALGAHGGA